MWYRYEPIIIQNLKVYYFILLRDKGIYLINKKKLKSKIKKFMRNIKHILIEQKGNVYLHISYHKFSICWQFILLAL